MSRAKKISKKETKKEKIFKELAESIKNKAGLSKEVNTSDLKLEKNISKMPEDLEFQDFSDSPQVNIKSNIKAPVLERIIGIQNGPIFFVEQSQRGILNASEKKEKDEFNYIFKGNEINGEKDYKFSDSNLIDEKIIIDSNGLRKREDYFPERVQQEGMLERYSEIKSGAFETLKIEKFERFLKPVMESGDRRGFGKEPFDVNKNKYKKYIPKLPRATNSS